MPLKDEISFFDLNEEMTYYEVEIWYEGYCRCRFFRTFASARRYFNEHARIENDCLKSHEIDEFYGPITYVLYCVGK